MYVITPKNMKLGTHSKVGISWGIITSLGIFGFYLSKRSIDKQRYEHMKVRERIRQANYGEYESSPRKYAN